METHAEFLDSGLRTIDDRFGGMEAYLVEAMGIGASERAELQARYLG